MTLRKVGFGIAVVIVMLGILLAIFGYYSFRRPLPQTDGAVRLIGLQEDVTIYRDAWGVPHIYATNADDLFFAQGYVHAQDRWWQMEMNRHIGMGNLSTILGNNEAVQNTDRFIRTVGWNRMAQSQRDAASESSQTVLDAYAKGVNSHVESRSQGDLAVQYTILGLTGRGFEVTPWESLHTFAWLTAYSWRQSSNFGDELTSLQLYNTLDETLLPNVVPPVDSDADMNYGRISPRLLGDIEPNNFAFLTLDQPRSNAWVVSGTMTDSGLPLLASEMQSRNTIPSDWYEVGLHCIEITPDCPYNVVGMSLAGVPGIIIGHNDSIAWSQSIANVDTQDTFVLRLNPDNPLQYEYNGEWVDMERMTEVIEVNDAEPIILSVYKTHFGMVISDPAQANGDEVLALQWAHDPEADVINAIMGLNTADSWSDFRGALRQWGIFPAQFLYADDQNNIGMQTAGTIPLRDQVDPNTRPTAGWTDDHQWQGLITFETLPSYYNPETAFIIAANQPMRFSDAINADLPSEQFRPASENYNRLQRITAQLMITAQHNADTFASLQADTYNAFAARLMPFFIDLELIVDDTAEDFDEQAYLEQLDYQQWLGAWNFQNDIDSSHTVFFSVLWTQIVDQVFDDQLTLQSGADDFQRQVIFELLEQPDSLWWDDIRTLDVIEDRDMTLQSAFLAAIETAEDQFGKQRSRWQWGDLHTTTFHSIPLGDSSVAAIEELLNQGEIATAGGYDSVNSTRWTTTRADRYDVLSVSAYRMIIDLSDFENSRSILSTGQSGHPASEHYADMIDLWRSVGYRDMRWEFETIREASDSTLRLRPALSVQG